MTLVHSRAPLVLSVLALAMIASTAMPSRGGTATATTTAAAHDRTAEDAAVAREIEQLEQQLITAIETKDFATYQNLVAEDYVAVGAAGEQTRAQAIEAYRSGALSLPGLKIGDIKVHVYGDTAMISARTFGDRVDKGKTVPNRVRYMRIWMKRQGRWRAVAQMARPLESD